MVESIRGKRESPEGVIENEEVSWGAMKGGELCQVVRKMSGEGKENKCKRFRRTHTQRRPDYTSSLSTYSKATTPESRNTKVEVFAVKDYRIV